MDNSTAYMFPGQGAQHQGMGAELFEKYSEVTSSASEALGFDVVGLCADPDDRLNMTEYTQPVLFVVNHLHWLERREQDVAPPAYMLGHSLGQYNALVASGMLSFDDALSLVRERGRQMAKHASGTMAAVMKLDLEDLRSLLADHPMGAEIDVANINSAQQIVLAGKSEALEAITPHLQEAGGFVVMLKVSGAFHSRLTAAAADAFSPFLERLTARSSQIQVICNVTARPLVPDELKMSLHRHITKPVQWLASIEYLLNEGVTDFLEVGAGKTLSGLQRYIVKQWQSERMSA